MAQISWAIGATGVKPAAPGRVDRAGHVAFQQDPLSFLPVGSAIGMADMSARVYGCWGF